ncbi:indolethylamine N-methyltransferase-like [Pseudophryne corroboree]|uniref:indolethylamine N-methyltransferase-like n=1 Tax=Pseudophryne corroboree TaxID=495146 RepID=UPI0030813570
MDYDSLKHYNELDIDQYLNIYFSASENKDILQVLVTNPMEKVHQFFSSESISGDTLIHISYGPVVHLLFPACQYFKEIKILDCNEHSIKALRKWKNKDPDAHDWSFAAQFAAKQGDGSSSSCIGYSSLMVTTSVQCIAALQQLGPEQLEMDGSQPERALYHSICQTAGATPFDHASAEWSTRFQDIEDMTRGKLNIEKSDLVKENPTSLKELPQADCVISSLALDGISKDSNAFRINLKNMSSVLKAGGHLLLFGEMNTSFFTVGNDKYYVFKYDEGFFKNSLRDEGFLIKKFEEVGIENLEKFSNATRRVFVVAQKQ